MTGDHIDLDRQFQPISSDETEQSFRHFWPRYGRLGWKDLKDLQRVVILAEAGSGKSSEFKEQWRRMSADDDLVCYATVQDLARSGLDGALRQASRKCYDRWKESEEAICWFFIDSVDEAKDQGLRFDDAVGKLADAIAGREERARILISGRYTDWDFIADRKAMIEWLSVPSAPPPPEPEFDEQIRETLHNKRREETADPAEKVSIVVMAPLDKPRISTFAANSGIVEIDAFLRAIEDGNLWHFASRPLDLGWMVEFWIANKAFGTLAQMLEASIDARLLDPKPGKRKRDPLSLDQAKRAIERIGAGLLLTGKECVRVPTEGVVPPSAQNAIAIEKLLPDWPTEQAMLLLGRPVFDPATLGRVRLHNDNEGKVRSYLTAKWLLHMEGCPPQTLDDLLFVDLYGYSLVRPDMLETAAWLSLWNPRVAEKVIERSPFALLTLGDPGSLPISTRIRAIEGALRGIDTVDRTRFWFDYDPLRRLADPALDPFIDEWWRQYGGDEKARHLLLKLIWMGRQHAGLEIVRQVAGDLAMDGLSQILAGRAVRAIGTPADIAAHAAFIVANAKKLERSTVLHALYDLFPVWVGVSDFFQVIDIVGISDGQMASIHPFGSDLNENLSSDADLTAFLAEVIRRIGPLRGDEHDSDFTQAFDSSAVAAASRLLGQHPDTAPDIVTDFILHLHSDRGHRGIDEEERELVKSLVATPARRRQSFWRAATVLRGHPWVKEDDSLNLFMMVHLGWPGGMNAADFEWLLEDMVAMPDRIDRNLALIAAHDLWRDLGKNRAQYLRIKRAVESDPGLVEMLTRWETPAPDSPEIQAQLRKLKKLEKRNAKHFKERDNSWVELIANLRADPTAFDHLRPQTESTADGRLVHLWQFMAWRSSSRSQDSISNLDMVEPIFGPELTRRFGKALIDFAYARQPLILAEKDQSQKRTTTSFDRIGLAGMSLAAATIPNWIETLDNARAEQATRYALIELNGFPDYLVPLAKAKPGPVAPILQREIDDQLAEANPQVHGILDRLAHSDSSLSGLVASHLQAKLAADEVPPSMMQRVADVLTRGLPNDADPLRELVLAKAKNTNDPETAAFYFSVLFAIDGNLGVDTLAAKASTLDPVDLTTLCSTLLPRLFGDRYHGEVHAPISLSFEKLEELVLIAFAGVRREDDLNRPSGKVHSITARDLAEEARSAIFSRFESTPGEATHAALIRLSRLDGFAIEPDWLIVLARRRAEADACLPAWQPDQIALFEKSHIRPPSEMNLPRIFVEGESDKIVLERALEIFFPDSVGKVIFETKRDGAGHRYVIDMLAAWRSQHKHHPEKPKAVGIVDGDAAAEKNTFNRIPDNIKSAKCFCYPTPRQLRGALAAGFKIPATLETLYPISIWEEAEAQGLLKRRNAAEVYPVDLINRILSGEARAEDGLNDAWATFVKFDFNGDAKIPTARRLCSGNDDTCKQALANFEAVLGDALQFLDLSKPVVPAA